MKSINFASIILVVIGGLIAIFSIIKSDDISDSKFSSLMNTVSISFSGAAGAIQVINKP
jgi:hypothetical protein